MEKLKPLPIDFDEAAHKYIWRPTGEVMPYSATQICGWDASPDKLANIESTRHEWERRGNACHKAMECLLTGEPFRQDDLDEFDSFLQPLLDHPFWEDFECLAAEYRMVDLKRGIGGSCDAVGIYRGRTVLVDLKTQKAGGRPYSTDRQMGAYCQLLMDHHKKLWLDEARTIWCRPGKTTVGKAQDPTRCSIAFSDAYADFIHFKGSEF